MRFRELPYRLRLYILAHAVFLAPLLDAVLQRPRPENEWLLAGLVLFTVIFSTWKVELTVLHAKMTPTYAVVCAALLLLGSQAAVLCAAVGAFVGTLVRPANGRWRVKLFCPPFYRVAFNVGNCAVACLSAVLVYEPVIQLAPRSETDVVFGLIAFSATYFALNTVGVSVAIALQQGLSWFSVWQQNFIWTAPSYFISAFAAAGIRYAFEHFGAWSLLFLSPLYLIYYSYRLYMDRLHLFAAKVQQDMSHIQELNRLNQAIIASLATAIDAKDRYTSSHINRVQHYAVSLARAAGLSGPELEAVATGALVHDIGKLGVPDHILGKPGKLAPEEFRRIQSHVTIGTEILSPIPFPFPVVDVVRTHHERWDGLGYPGGLRGEEIPIGGRIIAIVDVFDALTSDRPYRRAMSTEEAMRILNEAAGKQFDPHLVALFEQVLPQVMAEIQQLEQQERAEAGEANPLGEGTSALNQIRQAAAEMAAVADVAHSLAEQETLDQIVGVVVNRALALLPADTAVFYMPVSEGTELIAAAVEGNYRSKLVGMTIQMGEGVAGWVARHQQPRVNVSAALDVARRFTPEETMELSAATAVPVVHGPENLGVLAVYTLGYSVLSEHHLNILNILAEHAAVAIHNTRRYERQRELAYTDALTGVANSRNLVRHLDRLTFPGNPGLRSGESSFSIVMLDLDRFKEVNDTLGHLHGDELLRVVAETLTGVARPGDLVCRYAGDEFVLLLPETDREQAERIAHRIRNAVEAIPPVQNQIQVSTSVGVATFPVDGTDGRTLLHVADQRMYEDKFRRRQVRGLQDVEPQEMGTLPAAPVASSHRGY